jgi:uncharacterized membrane protein YdbT with pleckstrin-like domain
MLIIIGGLSYPGKGLPALVPFGVGFVWGVVAYSSFKSSSIRLTNQRVIVHIGALFKKHYAIPFSDITMVDIHQPSLGAMLNFGKIVIIHGGKYRSAFRMIASAAEFVTKLNEKVALARDRGNRSVSTRQEENASPS